MNLVTIRLVIQPWAKRIRTGLCGLIVCIAGGCPSGVPNGDGDGNGSSNGGSEEPTREIINFNSNFAVSELDPSISVMYNVEGTPDSISGFFVQVADDNPGAVPIADRIVTAVNLPVGAEQFKFNPQVAGVGFFRVGIIVVVDEVELPTIESTGIVQVQGRPNPFFIQPTQLLEEVEQGEVVTIRFDAGDPEGDVRWRLFYLSVTDSRSDPADELGTELGLGEGNVGLSVLDTTTLVPGDYELGVSATDTGFSISSTISHGLASRIVTITGPLVRVAAATNGASP